MTTPYDNATGAFDAARFAYGAALRTNGDDYNQQNANNVAEVKNTILTQKQNAFEQVATDMARTNDMTANLKLYQNRTADATHLASEIAKNNAMIRDQIHRDKDVTKRQFEINEWYSYKKQETAGMLMGVAIALGLLLLSLIGMKLGFLTSTAFSAISTILIVFIFGWVYWRASYNGIERDPMLWHRRRFTPPKPAPEATTCVGSLPTFNVDLGCATELEHKFQDLLQSTTTELTQFQEGGGAPKGLCSSTT
jgi:hypothetical protein